MTKSWGTNLYCSSARLPSLDCSDLFCPRSPICLRAIFTSSPPHSNSLPHPLAEQCSSLHTLQYHVILPLLRAMLILRCTLWNSNWYVPLFCECKNTHSLCAMNLCELRCWGLHFWCYIALRALLHFKTEQRADHMPTSIVLQSSYQQNLQGAQKLNVTKTQKKVGIKPNVDWW